MRSRRSTHDQVAEVARRRLEQLSAELAELRPEVADAPGAHASRPADPTSPIRDDAPGSPSPPLPSPALAPPPLPSPSDAPPEARAGRHLQHPRGPAIAVAGWIEDRLPPALQGRVRLGVAHLAVVGSLLLIALGLTGWWLSRPSGAGAPIPAVATPSADLVPLARSPAQSAARASSGSASPAPAAVAGALREPSAGVPAATPTGRIVVDVAGRVRRPGIATLPAGSRVVDALRAAGGPRRGVHLGSLNLARVLTDGEQILVGIPSAPGVAASAASAPSAPSAGSAGAPPLVNINSASEAELEELPDVGPVTAQAIVEYRTENGAFTSVEQLLDVSGIGDATLAKVAPFVTL